MPSHLSPTLPLIKQIVNSEDVTLLPCPNAPHRSPLRSGSAQAVKTANSNYVFTAQTRPPSASQPLPALSGAPSVPQARRLHRLAVDLGSLRDLDDTRTASIQYNFLRKYRTRSKKPC